jgi:ATP-dependent Lon protease
VLGIGGLKEKTVAALRNRITDVILPQENARDLDELPSEVKSGIRFHPVRTMDDVLAIALSRTVVARTPDASPTLVAH